MAEPEELCVIHLDDDREFAEVTAEFLERESPRLSVEPITAADTAFSRLEEGTIDCIVSDYDMPDLNGLEFLHRVRDDHPDIPFILFTGKGSEEVASDAISAGVTDYLQKDVGTDQYSVLANRIEQVIDKHRTEQELKVSRDRRAALFQNPNEAIVEIQFESDEPIIQDVNPGFETIFDFERTEVIGRPVAEVLVPESGSERHREIVDEVLDGNEVELEVERRTADGLRTFLLRVFPFEDSHGHRMSYALYTDITDQKARERRLETFHDVVENSAHSIYLTDRNGVIQYVNSAFESMTGYSEAEAVGQNPRILKSGVHDESFYAELWETITDGDIWHREVVNERKDGDRYRVNQTITPIEDGDGRIQHFVAINAEVTEGRDALPKLSVDQIAEIIVHEVRNPLNLAELRLEDLENETDHAALDGLREAIEQVGERLDWMDTLFYDEVDPGEDPVDIADVARRAWQRIPSAHATLSIADTEHIEADPMALEHLFGNLFRNAVEHGGDGVDVRVGVLEDGFFVADNGSGIATDREQAVFDPGHSTKPEDGGLGLTVVALVTENHGWEIDITSSQGGGTRFEINGVETVDSSARQNSVVNS